MTNTVVREDGKVDVTIEPSKGGDSSSLQTDVVLVSTGRRPFTKNIGLEELGIGTDKLGRVEVSPVVDWGIGLQSPSIR